MVGVGVGFASDGYCSLQIVELQVLLVAALLDFTRQDFGNDLVVGLSLLRKSLDCQIARLFGRRSLRLELLLLVSHFATEEENLVLGGGKLLGEAPPLFRLLD